MFRKWITASAVAAVAGLVGVSSLYAAPTELMGVDASGHTFSSGWTYDIPSQLAGQVSLVFIRAEGNNFYIEKDAVLTSATDPIVIDFAPVAGDTQSNLVINDEALRNSTGEDWTGFRMVLSSPSAASFAFGVASGSTPGTVTGGIGDFSINPFTTVSFAGSADLVVGGGTVANGSTWFPGTASSDGLALVASGGNGVGFQLKEMAITESTGGGPVPIPLPASVWTGLSGLIGLGLLGAAKSARRHLV